VRTRKEEWPVRLTVTSYGHGNVVMSENVDRGKNFVEKVKALADAGMEKLNAVDWQAKGEFAKSKAIVFRDKIISTWNSGRNGKAIVVAAGAMGLFLLKSCLFGNGATASAYCFSEKDFQAESESKQMFYVKSGKDDGLKAVVPNLRKIPAPLKAGTSLCGAFNPGLEDERHHKGWAYYNDPEYPTGYYCEVVHVGDGWVVVKPNSMSMFGEYLGYIETDDSYIEGQNLNAGFYTFVGTQKVPLVNGSTHTMHAFVKIDSESNILAVEAVRYNLKAHVATEEENQRRCTKREYFAELPVVMEDIQKLSACTVKTPDGAEECIGKFAFDVGALRDVVCLEQVDLNDLVKHAQKKDFEYFYTFCDKAVCRPKFLVDKIKKSELSFNIKGFDEQTKKINGKYKVAKCETVNQMCWMVERREETATLATEFYLYETDEVFEDALMSGGAKDFVEHWNTKYGKK